MASDAAYSGAFSIRMRLSNTVEGMNIRSRTTRWIRPSGFLTCCSSTIRVIGGAGRMKRSFTHACPIPPGLHVARI